MTNAHDDDAAFDREIAERRAKSRADILAADQLIEDLLKDYREEGVIEAGVGRDYDIEAELASFMKDIIHQAHIKHGLDMERLYLHLVANLCTYLNQFDTPEYRAIRERFWRLGRTS